ncbi:hypothetical protein GCM10008995_04260 [Halobellus salinus]|uniref:DUF1059 domain-containing protein n=1 Tax=Halobellus salinus TaxID=931585 RepID=A0A830E7H5_9EURY|nr:hypothetical protein [Halobellus salinus]GGI97513.1 hypothetical protein GCM10008995_04260 [Halobellus salinus]SMP07371.1 hypothetical protein SAMN06265347_102254 [Halobellus salinus]
MVPGTADTANDDLGAYHIVCHDCPTELLADGEAEAQRHLSEHRSSTGHNVEFAALRGVDMENE